MPVRNSWRKPAAAAPGPSALIVRLIVLSMSLWMLFGLAGLFLATRDMVTQSYRLGFFDDLSGGLHTLKASFFLMAVGGAAGALCSLPAVVLLVIGRRPTEVIQRKPGRFKLIQKWVGRALPFFVLAGSHLVLASLGFGSAPQWARSLTRDSNPLADYSRFVNDLFFHPAESESTRDAWKAVMSGTGTPQAMVVFAPSSLMTQAAGLSKIKRTLGEPQRFFADSASAPAFFAELFHGEESANLAFHLPVPDAFAMKSISRFLKEYGPNLGVGWDEAKGRPSNLLVRFSPEWVPVEKVLTGDPEGALDSLDKKRAVTLRLMQSQPHLFALARFGVFALFDPTARWTALVSDDVSVAAEILEEASSRLRGQTKGGFIFLHLSELEKSSRRVVPPLAPLRWPDTLAPAEQRWLVNKYDSLLGFGFSVSAGPESPAIFLVPYPDGESRSQLTHAFVRARGGESLEGLLPAKLGTGFLTVDDVTLTLRHSLGLSEPTSGESGDHPLGAESGLHCERHFADLSSLLSDEHVPGDLIHENYWDAVGRYSGARFEFPSALSFLSGSGFEHSVICRPTARADGRSFDTSQSWIIRWVRQEEADIILGTTKDDARGELRKALVRLESEAFRRRGDARRSAKRSDARPVRTPQDPPFDMMRYANYELFRLAPDPQSGIVLRRATQVEGVEFFKKWGAQVEAQFEQGARAQLH